MFLYSVSVAGFIVADFPFYNVDDNSLILIVVVAVNIINHQAPNPSSPRNDKSPQMLGISRAFTRNCNKANIISSIMCAVSGARRELAVIASNDQIFAVYVGRNMCVHMVSLRDFLPHLFTTLFMAIKSFIPKRCAPLSKTHPPSTRFFFGIAASSHLGQKIYVPFFSTTS